MAYTVTRCSLCNGYPMKLCCSLARFWNVCADGNSWRQYLLFVVLTPNLLCLTVAGRAWGQEAIESPLENASARSTATAAENASQPEPEVTLASIRAAVRQLEAGELAVRDQAEKDLVAMGSSALAYLPEVTARTSGELKVRLQRIRQALQQTNIENYFEASLVTLNGKMKLTEAIEQISQQTKNPIKLNNLEGVAEMEVDLQASDTPFWDVMSAVMSQANLRVNTFGTTESELVFSAGAAVPTAVPPHFTSGPFRLDVVSISSTLPFNSMIGGQLDLSFNVTWEPRLQPVFMQIPMASLTAELASGQTLSASNPQAAPEVPLNLGGCSTQIDIQLERPERSAKMIRKLAGEFTIAVPSQSHEYVFEKFGNGARQSEKFGDVTVTLEGARRNGAVYEMRLFVEFGDAQGALDSFRGWILSNEAYLRDSRDTRIQNVGLNTYAITPSAVGIAYLFQINGDPNDFKLVYESPAAVTKQKVQYELQDIELP